MNEESPQKTENTKLPKILCWVFTFITLITVVLGFYLKNPFIIICGIVPVAIYEAIRTEGYYTKAGSIAVAILVILEILAIKGLIKLNLAQVIGQSDVYFSGYILPLGEITFIFPAIAALISLVLLRRTYGIYTKWLSVLLLISSISLVYLVNREILFELIRNQRYWF